MPKGAAEGPQKLMVSLSSETAIYVSFRPVAGKIHHFHSGIADITAKAFLFPTGAEAAAKSTHANLIMTEN